VLGATVPDDWPDEELQGLLDVYEPRLRSDPSLLGLGPWIVIAAGEVVGSAGFVGPPNERGELELGYGILEEHRNRGYATEAGGALVAWALARPGVERVIARRS
jgi:RimJ/RimL family protein N-acetyltransferase